VVQKENPVDNQLEDKGHLKFETGVIPIFTILTSGSTLRAPLVKTEKEAYLAEIMVVCKVCHRDLSDAEVSPAKRAQCRPSR